MNCGQQPGSYAFVSNFKRDPNIKDVTRAVDAENSLFRITKIHASTHKLFTLQEDIHVKWH
jgi:hypothetical protein